jgi:thiamine biosynthesis lipoprotein ApbE
MEADALSTACFVLGTEEALKLIASRPEVDALFVTKAGRTLSTPGFPSLPMTTEGPQYELL